MRRRSSHLRVSSAPVSVPDENSIRPEATILPRQAGGRARRVLVQFHSHAHAPRRAPPIALMPPRSAETYSSCSDVSVALFHLQLLVGYFEAIRVLRLPPGMALLPSCSKESCMTQKPQNFPDHVQLILLGS